MKILTTLFLALTASTSAFAADWKAEYPSKVTANDRWGVVLYAPKTETIDVFVDKYLIGTMVWSARVQAHVYVISCRVLGENRKLIFRSESGEELVQPLAVRPKA